MSNNTLFLIEFISIHFLKNGLDEDYVFSPETFKGTIYENENVRIMKRLSEYSGFDTYDLFIGDVKHNFGEICECVNKLFTILNKANIEKRGLGII